MSKNTTLTAFCDGAANCWSVVDALAPYCKEVTKILDWFHIRQAYDKAMIALPEQVEQLRSSKYKVWHGKAVEAISKLEELRNDLLSKDYLDSKIERVRSIITYLYASFALES